jgi:hypothetical protein
MPYKQNTLQGSRKNKKATTSPAKKPKKPTRPVKPVLRNTPIKKTKQVGGSQDGVQVLRSIKLFGNTLSQSSIEEISGNNIDLKVPIFDTNWKLKWHFDGRALHPNHRYTDTKINGEISFDSSITVRDVLNVVKQVLVNVAHEFSVFHVDEANRLVSISWS